MPVVPVNEWLIALIVAVTPIVVTILKFIVSSFGSKIPTWLKPVIAMLLGALAAYLGGLVFGNPVLAAVVGLAVIGIREIVVQLGRAMDIKFFQQ